MDLRFVMIAVDVSSVTEPSRSQAIEDAIDLLLCRARRATDLITVEQAIQDSIDLLGRRS